ncbi:hypothetical protein [Acetobacter okinawensis]|nr:hypothetical protein [Acetobacter okinawensis]
MSDIVVVYHSGYGHTRKVAEHLAKLPRPNCWPLMTMVTCPKARGTSWHRPKPLSLVRLPIWAT